jgi:hypothetical protein
MENKKPKKQMPIFKIRSEITLYPGVAGWHFLSIPKNQSKEIKEKFSSLKRNWGSLPVEVTIGKTTWKTSIFPDTKVGVYMLPLKAEIRKKENLKQKQTVSFSLKITGSFKN